MASSCAWACSFRSSAATFRPSCPSGCPGNSSGRNISRRALALYWFCRGLLRLAVRGPAAFVAQPLPSLLGVVSIYAVLQTRIDYFALHMFFVHRAQHFVLHHLGAFLIALGASGPVLWAGMPGFAAAGARLAAGAGHRRRHPASRRCAGSVRRADLSLADSGVSHARDAGRTSLRRDEREHGGRRHLLLVPDPRSARAPARGSAAACGRCSSSRSSRSRWCSARSCRCRPCRFLSGLSHLRPHSRRSARSATCIMAG